MCENCGKRSPIILSTRISDRHCRSLCSIVTSVCENACVSPPTGQNVEKHGSSELPVYSFTGGLLAGRKETAFIELERYWPAAMYSIDTVTPAMSNVLMSIQRMVALCVLPKMLFNAPGEDSIVGGWSLGSRPAISTAYFLVTLIQGVRASFMLDDRGKNPMPTRLMLAQRQVCR